MTKKEDWLNKLHTRVQNSDHVKAPEGLLDDIKKEMAHRGVAPAHTAVKGARIVPLWVYSVASVAAILAVCFYLGGAFTDPSPSLLPTTSMESRTPAIRPNHVETGETPAGQPEQTGQNSADMVASVFKPAVANVVGGTPDTDNTEPDMPDVADHHDAAVEPSDNKTDANTHTSPAPVAPRPAGKPSRRSGGEPQPLLAMAGNHQSHFSIGASYSGASGASHNAQGMMMTSSDPYGKHEPEFSGDKNLHQVTASEDMKTTSKHRQPVKLGLSVRYNLDSRWSLQSGLTYSWLSSEFSFHKGRENNKDEQTLHYVGIPLAASYNFVKTKRVNVYATAGGEAEKLVRGVMKHSSKTAEEAGPNSVTVKEKRLQFSVNAAVGAEYKLSRDVSIYAEPGVSHYFNNGSAVDNIYKDTPTGFNLNVGFRINLNQ